MTAEELILIDSSKVRRDSNLMLFYVETFLKEFGYRPNCAGCTFNSEWIKLVRKINGEENLVTLQKHKKMATFILKRPEGKILSYKKNGLTYRKYDNSLTEEFVIEYLSNGTEEELSERKKLFSKLPKTETKEETSEEQPKRGRKKNNK